MKTLGGGSVALGAALILFALTASPAFAAGPHGGGGGSGGGGHASAGGGGGGRAFSGGGGGRAFAGGHAGASHFGGSHLAAPAFSYRGGYSGGSVRGGAVRGGGYGYSHASPSAARAVAGGYGRPGVAYTRAGNYAVHGGGRYYGRGGHYGGHWGGGYWRGGYWPPVFWGAGFAWFLPVLPGFYSTYYWNSVPYYYYNDVYYTYDPSASGYVATTPPPALDSDAAASDSEGAGPGAAGPDSAPGVAGTPANSDGLYAYPKNGQSEEQQAQDRSECAQWAGAQTGADAATTDDYRRAMSACLQGRGYSVN